MNAPPNPHAPRSVDTKLEVVIIPVSDVERAKRFYDELGVAAGRRFRHR